MGVQVLKNHFDGLAGALDDIKNDGVWPTTLVSEPSPPPHMHWHAVDVHGYVISGTTWILDGETNERLTIEPGDKLVLPAGALHIEGEGDETVTYIVALPEPLPFAEVFTLHPADDPNRPGASGHQP